jgi:hypothetical protein
MKNHKKFSIIFYAVMILSLLLAGSATAKSDSKVEVCHQRGNGSYVLINISDKALQSHLAHGDGAPGAAVPNQAGMFFGTDCSLSSTAQNERVQSETLPPATKNGKKADKVDVCHLRGNEVFILININRNALSAHLLHGDGLPNEGVPNQPGKQFSATCSMVEVPQEELVQSISVFPDGETYSFDDLKTGQLYELKVSGTYGYNNDVTKWADAEYFLSDTIIKGDYEYTSFPNILDLTINGPNANTDWGDFNPEHTYTLQVTGPGVPLNFAIYDSYYDDNTGFLTVEVWKINW